MCKIYNPRKIDNCMKTLIENLNEYFGDDLSIKACCCGHAKYNMSIIVKSFPEGIIYDFCSDKVIPRKKRFYVKDKQGYYYIPEVEKMKSKNINSHFNDLMQKQRQETINYIENLKNLDCSCENDICMSCRRFEDIKRQLKLV